MSVLPRGLGGAIRLYSPQETPVPFTLIRRLSDDDPRVRSAAARELCSLYFDSPVVAAMAALRAALLGEQNASARLAMANTVAVLSGRPSSTPSPGEDTLPEKRREGRRDDWLRVPVASVGQGIAHVGIYAPPDLSVPRDSIVAQGAEAGYNGEIYLRYEDRLNRREETPIAQQPEKPPIRMEEIWEAEAEVKELQAAVVVRIQQLLDSLAGRKGAGDDQNKQIADAVCDIARKSGSELLCKGQVSAVRWYRGIFEARLTDWSKNTLEKKPEFPQLRARAKSRDREASRGV